MLEEDPLKLRIHDHLMRREGFDATVYKDTLGFLTVGVGHRVISSDNLRLGDKVSISRVTKLLDVDSEKAFQAAKKQAEQMGKESDDFIVALTSVNFQLGTGWPKTFNQSFKLLVEGKGEEAIKKLKGSKWAQQTPVRVTDFIEAIEAEFARGK